MVKVTFTMMTHGGILAANKRLQLYDGRWDNGLRDG